MTVNTKKEKLIVEQISKVINQSIKVDVMYRSNQPTNLPNPVNKMLQLTHPEK